MLGLLRLPWQSPDARFRRLVRQLDKALRRRRYGAFQRLSQSAGSFTAGQRVRLRDGLHLDFGGQPLQTFTVVSLKSWDAYLAELSARYGHGTAEAISRELPSWTDRSLRWPAAVPDWPDGRPKSFPEGLAILLFPWQIEALGKEVEHGG